MKYNIEILIERDPQKRQPRSLDAALRTIREQLISDGFNVRTFALTDVTGVPETDERQGELFSNPFLPEAQ